MAHPLAIAGLVLSILALIFLIVAFSTPYWLQSFESSDNRFIKLGLWEACFNDYTYYKDYMGKRYDGCWWIFSYEYRPIWSWLNPPWFLGIQILLTLTLLTKLASVILQLMLMVKCCPSTKATCLDFLNSGMMFGSGAIIAISCILFGINSDADREWLPRPEQNYLSWSFGMCVFSGFLAIFAGMCLVVEAIRFRLTQQHSKPAPPYGGYVMKSVPPRY
ncbi:hypothetical protein ScPMuIL_008705 [Solemya velum]